MGKRGRLKGPYGAQVLWGEEFVDRYRDALEDLYLTDDVRKVAHEAHFAGFVDGEHSMAAEKRHAVAFYDQAGFPDELYACRYVVEDVVRCGFSCNSALISIQMYIMLVDTGVLEKPAARHLPIDPFATQQVDAVSPALQGASTSSGEFSEANAPSEEASAEKGGEAVCVERKCSNCIYFRNPDYCSRWAVCDDWKYAEKIPSYYPTWEDMRGGMFSDYLSRSNDTYIQ